MEQTGGGGVRDVKNVGNEQVNLEFGQKEIKRYVFNLNAAFPRKKTSFYQFIAWNLGVKTFAQQSGLTSGCFLLHQDSHLLPRRSF